MKFLLVLAATSTLVACHGHFPGMTPTTDCETHCTHLAALGCAEGASPNCVQACNETIGTPLNSVDWGCSDSASTKSSAQKCGVRFCQ